MKSYGVKALAQLSGVSVRTLHHYDKIGLLKPSHRTEAGYRYYGEAKLFRLQQILFYKELDFSLKEIRVVLDEPSFDLVTALKQHKQALQDRQARISTLLVTIDKTIHHLKKEKMMSKPEELYEGLPKEFGTTHRQEAMDKYGKKTLEKAENELLKMGKPDFKKLQADFEQVNAVLFSCRYDPPDSESVQQLIARHYDIIRKFWGTHQSKDKQAEAYAGLGQLYVQDERYTMVDGKAQPEYARFLQQAMRHFADTVL